MAYQLDTQSSLIDVHSRFISRIFKSQNYKSYNNTTSIANYIQRKKDSGNLDEKIRLHYSNHDGQISNYHLRLVTFFLKEGIDHVALRFIQNDCLIKPIDLKYGFNTNNHQIQVLLLKFVDQMNLWSPFSSQIQTLLSQLQPYDLFNVINTYPNINTFKINFQNPKFVVYTLNNINSHLKALQFSQFSSQVNDQLSLLQQQFQQLSDKESLLNFREQQLSNSRPPLSSYPVRTSSNDNDSLLSLQSRNLSQTLLLDSQPTLQNQGSQQEPHSSPHTPKDNIFVDSFTHLPFKTSNMPISQPSDKPSPPLSPTSQSKSNQHTPNNQPVTTSPPTPSSPLPTSNNTATTPQSQFIFTYLQNQLSTYFNDSNKVQKTKITKEVKQLLKQKTIQKNSLYQQYIDSHSANLNQNQIKLLQKWLDIPSKLSS